MHIDTYQSLRGYIGFDTHAEALLRAFEPYAQPHFKRIIDDFYAAILEHPEASQAITGGSAQVQRLKSFLIGWLKNVLTGPYDEEYLKRNARIGEVHVRIGLPQQYMLGASDRIRNHLRTLAATWEEHQINGIPSPDGGEPLSPRGIHQAINQVLDLELSIMFESYQTDWSNRVRIQERLAAVGQLTSTMGHELRNPLGIVSSSVYLLEQKITRANIEDPSILKHLERIRLQVGECAQIIESLLSLTREVNPSKTELDLEALCLEQWQRLPTEKAKLSISLSSDTPLLADKVLFAQLVSNLFRNMLEATQDQGQMWITAENSRGGLQMIFGDNGPGIEKDDREVVFDALHTTKARGTGLGLAFCRRVAIAHGGEMRLLDPSAMPLLHITHLTASTRDESQAHQLTLPGAHFQIWLPNH